MELMNDNATDWNNVRKSVYSLRTVMSKFNFDVDMVFADFNKTGADTEHYSLDMNIQQQKTGDNQCQITHIVDAEKCICYAIDING